MKGGPTALSMPWFVCRTGRLGGFMIVTKKWTDQCEDCSLKEKSHCYSRALLVGAFPLREKCPTIAVTFFQTTILTHRSTFLTNLTILKSYNSYLANLKYWRKSLRSSIFTSSKKLKGTKGYSLRVVLAL